MTSLEEINLNAEQQKDVLKKIITAYPRFLDKKTDYHDPTLKIKLWSGKLAQWDYDKTLNNLDRHIETSVFEPKIAEIKPVFSENKYEWEQKLKRIMNGGGENSAT